ncbi:hypothetical protein ABIC85_001170 [Oerskovia enterophila]
MSLGPYAPTTSLTRAARTSPRTDTKDATAQ